jgi:hypothetical protein
MKKCVDICQNIFLYQLKHYNFKCILDIQHFDKYYQAFSLINSLFHRVNFEIRMLFKLTFIYLLVILYNYQNKFLFCFILFYINNFYFASYLNY